MISFPNLPTDNLNKFLFIGGIIMIFFGTYIFYNQTLLPQTANWILKKQ